MAKMKEANDNQVDEQALERDPRTAHNKKRQRRFLEELAASSNVTASAKRAELSTSTVYYWRDHDSAFAAAWLDALAAGYALLEMEMLHRARGGVEKKVYHAGKCIDTIREYNDLTALRLLMAHKEMVTMTRAAQAELRDNAIDIRTQLDRKLSDMRIRLQKRRALEQKDTPVQSRP